MSNVVEIVIKADDASAPGFASALAQVEALKKAAQGIGFTFAAPNLSSQLQQIKQKMQAAGLADLIDYNLNQGQIGQQLLMLKRKIGQAGISDMLDINLNQDQITEQLSKLSNDAFNIPVGFDVAAFPKIEESEAVSVPVHFQIPDNLSLPKLGETVDVGGLDQAVGKFQQLGIASDALTKDFGNLNTATASSDEKLAALEATAAGLKSRFDMAAASILGAGNATHDLAASSDDAVSAAANFGSAIGGSKKATDLAAEGMNDLVHAGNGFGIVWRTLTAKVELFGGALTQIGVPAAFAEANVLHILADSLIEISAVLVPAAIAFSAFGIAALPVLETMYDRLSAVSSVSNALGKNIYPLSGGFSKLAQDVQPEVYTLFGDALAVAGSKAGTFGILAKQAGDGVDQLSARTAVALSSGGMSTFMASAVDDMVKIGTVFENIFGTFGNILKVMPGYAEDLLNVVVDVTGGIEKLSGSGLGQFATGAFLAFHGFVLWAGLGATAAVGLGNGLVTLASKFGLAEAGALSFDAVQFGTGIKLMGSYAADAAVGLVTFAGAEDLAAASTGFLEAGMMALGAINPLVWVGAGLAGLAALVYWLGKAGSATQSYDNVVKNSLSGTPITQLSVAITQDQANTIDRLNQAQTELNSTTQYGTVGMNHAGVALQGVTAAYSTQQAVVKGYQGELTVLNGYQSNFNTLLKAAGGNMAAFSQVGITSQQIIGANKQQLAQMVLELQGASDAFKALSLSSNESSAAINAESSIYNTSVIPALQNLGKAESNVIANIVGGEDALATYKQYLVGTGTAAKAAGDNFNGLSANSITLSGDFYGQLIPAAESLINSLQAQSIGTSDLTKVVATEVSQMSAFADGNSAAKSVLVDLVNNALGPGTVSLQTLNSWVGKNSTSLSGFDSIVAKSTITAGGLANVLQTDVSAAFAKELLSLSGADSALKNYTTDILNNQTQTNKGASDRQQLISDLEKAGLNAQQAAKYVDSLTTAEGKIPKSAPSNISVTAAGAWSIRETDLPGGASGLVVQGGQHGKDSVHLMGMPGEVMIPTWIVNSGGIDHLAGLIPGWNGSGQQSESGGARMAQGGVVGMSNVGNPAQVGGWIDKAWNETNQLVIDTDKKAMVDGINKAINAAKAKQAAAANISASAGPGGGAPAANAALARKLYPPWGSGSQWAAWNDVAMRESGWNQFARNAESGAYGIPQALPPSKMGAAANPPESNPTAQINWMIGYIKGRYGTPEGAWDHELSAGWYGDGLDAVINTPTRIGVGERGAEHVQVTPMSRANQGGQMTVTIELGPNFQRQSGLTSEMLSDIRATVRTHGGGDVQAAFGRSN